MSFSGMVAELRAEGPAEQQVQGAVDLRAGAATRVEEAEDPESAVSSPPMAMDDPGTPGPQGIELNLVGEMERAGEGRGSESLFDLNYGIGQRLQLKYERPYVTTGQAGEHQQTGLGATKIGVKWRFLDRDGWQLAAYPAYQFDDGFTVRDEEGNPEESEGRSTSFPLLISKTVARVYTAAANLGYSYNTDHSTSDWVVAFGLGRALGSNGRILTEVYSARDERFDNRQTDVRVGVVWLLYSKAFEFPAYAAIGRSIGPTEEGRAITSFTIGVSIIKPGA
jgi:hypothetical protein